MEVRLFKIGETAEHSTAVEIEEVKTFSGVRGIYYLDDGRSIHHKLTQSAFELYDAEGELILKTKKPFRAPGDFHVLEQLGVHFIIYDDHGNLSVVNIEKNSQRPIVDLPSFLFYSIFGADHQTLFFMNRNRKSVHKVEYVINKWMATQEIKILSEGSEEEIKNIYHVGSNSLLIFVSNKTKDRISMYLVHKMKKTLIKTFANCRSIEVEKKLTPSHLILDTADMNHSSRKYLVDLKGGVQLIPESGDCATPDGKQFIRVDKEDETTLDWQTYSERSLDGRRLGGTTIDQYASEIVLKRPFRYPIYTVVEETPTPPINAGGVGGPPTEWIRLMSDGTVESSGSWPLFLFRQSTRSSWHSPPSSGDRWAVSECIPSSFETSI